MNKEIIRRLKEADEIVGMDYINSKEFAEDVNGKTRKPRHPKRNRRPSVEKGCSSKRNT